MKKIIFALLCATSFSSCDLEFKVYDTLSSDSFPITETDAEYLVNASYSYLKSGVGCEGFYSFNAVSFPTYSEMTTDIMTCNWGDGGKWDAVSQLRYLPSEGMSNDVFNININRIGILSKNIDRIEHTQINDDKKKRFIAEIKTLRSWIAYLFYINFGPIVLPSIEDLNNPNQDKVLPRATEEEMDIFIEQGILESISYLPLASDLSGHLEGRLTQGAARAILMKFYMFKKRWKDAEQQGREIQKLGYDLEEDYASIFLKFNTANKESIFTIPSNSNNPNYMYSWSAPLNYPHNNKNIQSWGGYKVWWDFYDTFEANDKRKNLLISEYTGIDGVFYDRNTGKEMSNLGKGVIIMKYGEDPDQVGGFNSHPIIAFRYADILLMLAEAVNMQNETPTEEAIGWVNEVRHRAGLDDLSIEKSSSKEKFNDAILEERGHELYCEGFRREDLIRHGKFIEYAKKRSNTLTSEHLVLLPIPNSFIVANKGIVLQNPGY